MMRRSDYNQVTKSHPPTPQKKKARKKQINYILKTNKQTKNKYKLDHSSLQGMVIDQTTSKSQNTESKSRSQFWTQHSYS